MIRKAFKIAITGLILLTMTLTSCKHDRHHPGYVYMPDMCYSEPSDAYTASQVFSDSLTMRIPVKGTIPRGYIPYPYKAKSYTDQIAAGKELVNPMPVNAETLAAGKAQYDIYCMLCHGKKGKGDGHLYTSKKFPMKPTSLTEKYVQGKPDGELFHIITTGSLSGLMGAHGAQVKSENRWAIINYMRSLAMK